MTASTKIQWRVQVRKSRAHKWRNKGLFEVRWMARGQARYYREQIGWCENDRWDAPYGFGNTRVVRYVKGA